MAQTDGNEAEAALRDGRLDDAVKALETAVRAEPDDVALRVFLFQLSALVGDWKRARAQLDFATKLDATITEFAEAYKVAIAAEGVREAVWAGYVAPAIFGEPGAWIALFVEALRLDATGSSDAALALRSDGLNAAPTTSGHRESGPFKWFADSDCRLGPLLELVIAGEYHWMSLEQIAVLSVSPQVALHDYVWMEAEVTLVTGATLAALIPARYPGATSDPDAAVRAGRKTEWAEMGEGLVSARGARVFATETDDVALSDAGRIVFADAAARATAALEANT